MLLLFSLLPVPSSFFHRDAVTNYHLSEYKKELERVEKATPEERRKMEEELVLRPQAVGAKQRRKRFEASSSDSMISEMSLSAATSKDHKHGAKREIGQGNGHGNGNGTGNGSGGGRESKNGPYHGQDMRKVKRIKSCPPAMLEPCGPGGLSGALPDFGGHQISLNLNITSNAMGGMGGMGGIGGMGVAAQEPHALGSLGSLGGMSGMGAMGPMGGIGGMGMGGASHVKHTSTSVKCQAEVITKHTKSAHANAHTQGHGGHGQCLSHTMKEMQGMQGPVFQRSLTGNMKIPACIRDPSNKYNQAGAGMRAGYAPHTPTVPVPMWEPRTPAMAPPSSGLPTANGVPIPPLKQKAPSAIEKVDFLVGDFFSGLPDGTENSWQDTMDHIAEGYPHPIGAMIGMQSTTPHPHTHTHTHAHTTMQQHSHAHGVMSGHHGYGVHGAGGHGNDNGHGNGGYFYRAAVSQERQREMHGGSGSQGEEGRGVGGVGGVGHMDHCAPHAALGPIGHSPPDYPMESFYERELGFEAQVDRDTLFRMPPMPPHAPNPSPGSGPGDGLGEGFGGGGDGGGEGEGGDGLRLGDIDCLHDIDHIDGVSMTKILVDMGFSGETLFTLHT